MKIHHHQLGEFELIAIETQTQSPMLVHELLPNATLPELKVLFADQPRCFDNDPNVLLFTQNVFVVRVQKHVVLVDTGQVFAGKSSALLKGLNNAGIQAQDVDFVLLTHRDTDHVGGTVFDDGTPVYPKAQHFMTQREYHDYAKEQARATQFERWIVPLLGRNQLQVVDNEATILPGVRFLPTPGHRSGASSVCFESQAQRAFLLADTLHSGVQVAQPSWSSVYDWNADVAATTRQHILEQAERNAVLLGIPHAPFPGLGFVTRDTKGHACWEALG